MSDTHGWISKDWCNWYHPGAAKDRQNSKYINHWLTSFLASPYLFEVVIYFQTCWYLLHVGWYLFESVCISDIWTSALKHYQFSWSISFKRYGPAKLILSSSFSRHLLAQGGLDSKPNCYQFWGSISFKIYCLLAPEPCLRTISLFIPLPYPNPPRGFCPYLARLHPFSVLSVRYWICICDNLEHIISSKC